ncbi:MAG: Septal ring factor EnvC [Bacteroidetes bacterium]|nr:Septal ring factor EnvC [Bacteroidota bacterium]
MKYVHFLLIPALFFCISTIAQTGKIKQLEIQRKKALLEIENTNKLLIDTKKITQNLSTRIKLIANQIDSRKQIVSLLEQESDALMVQQIITQKEIELLQKELKGKQNNYAKAINGMIYKKQSENKLLYILSGKSLAESMRRMRFLKEYSEWRSKEADAIKTKTEQLHQKRADLEQQRRSKIILIGQKDAEQQKLKKEEEAHRQEIAEAKQKQGELRGIIAEKRKQANLLNAQIERLIAEEVARQEQEARRKAEEKAKRLAAEEKSRHLAAQEKAMKEAGENSTRPKTKKKEKENTTSRSQGVEANKAELEEERATKKNEILLAEAPSENIALSNNFAANKGRLPVPVSGRYSIVSGFGEHQQSQHVTINSNGIDIQTQAGADARAAFGGEVSKIVAFPGYNNCIIIRHGNYYTFYGNIQSVFVHVGQNVKTGQSLGKIFTDSDTGVTKMHFQLWNGTSKQNPTTWLRR